MNSFIHSVFKLIDHEWCVKYIKGNFNASIAVIYIEDEDALIFIERAERPNDRWSGHIAFPGGFRKNNETSYVTVIREVYEELGIDLHNSIHLGAFKPIVTRIRKILVVPHIFMLYSRPRNITPDTNEISNVFIVKINNIRNDKCPHNIPYPPCYIFPGISKGKAIWGLTARILKQFLI